MSTIEPEGHSIIHDVVTWVPPIFDVGLNFGSGWGFGGSRTEPWAVMRKGGS